MKKKLFLALFLLIFIFLIQIKINAQNLYFNDFSQNNNFNERKDPLVAALLSWYMPGLGLIYSESFIKGFIYYSIDTLLLGYIFSKVATFKVSMNQVIGFNLFGFSDIQGFDINRVKDVGLIGLAWMGFRIFNIIDSAFTAYNYNIKNNVDVFNQPNISPFIAGLMSWLYPGVGQFMVRDYFTGSIFVMLDFIQKIYLFGILISQFPNAENPIDLLNNIDNINFSDLSIQTKLVIITYFGLDLGKRFFSSILAYNKAKDNNLSRQNKSLSYNYYFNVYPILFTDLIGMYCEIFF